MKPVGFCGYPFKRNIAGVLEKKCGNLRLKIKYKLPDYILHVDIPKAIKRKLL